MDYSILVHIGSMDKVCQHCQAFKWEKEAPGMCCNSGKLQLPLLACPDEPLKSYLSGETDTSRHFLENVRKYNSAFQVYLIVNKIL